jgi:hypothetical protein
VTKRAQTAEKKTSVAEKTPMLGRTSTVGRTYTRREGYLRRRYRGEHIWSIDLRKGYHLMRYQADR